MPVSAVEHRIRTGLYNCKGVLLLSSTPKSTLPPSRSNCNGDQDKRQLCVSMVLTALLLLTYRVYLITVTVLEVVLQQKIRLSLQCELQVGGYSLSKVVCALTVLTLQAGMTTAILLLMSGDVETNPGPTILNIDDNLMPIKEAIWDARSQWRNIGRKLGLKEGDIQAMRDPNDAGECLHEVLSMWIHSGKAVIHDLLQVLDSKVIDRSDIVREIHSRVGDERIQVGLDPAGNSQEQSTAPLQRMHQVLSETPTLEELCTLPIEKMWYQVGLWLGLDGKVLREIKVNSDGNNKEDLKQMFRMLLLSVNNLYNYRPTSFQENTSWRLPVRPRAVSVSDSDGIASSDDSSAPSLPPRQLETPTSSDDEDSTAETHSSSGFRNNQSLLFDTPEDDPAQLVHCNSDNRPNHPSVSATDLSCDSETFSASDGEMAPPLLARPLGTHQSEDRSAPQSANDVLYINVPQQCQAVAPHLTGQKRPEPFCYSHLIKAVINTGNHATAEKICAQKGVSLTEYLETTSPGSGSSPPKCLVSYANKLKEKYKQLRVIPDDWPPTIAGTDNQFTNLALILTEEHKSIDRVETIAHDYAHGKIDNIIARKQTIEVQEVFFPITDKKTRDVSSRLTILMDGAPGVGKSTIARKICIDWANGNMLQEYMLVILVQLREIVNANDIADLLPSCSKSRKAEVAECMDDSNISGRRILFIFDGFDELSSENRSHQSFFLKIIRGEVLHNCSVLVTSRPYSSSHLRTMSRVNRFVEVIGFSSEQIVQCVQKTLPSAEQASKLIKMLKERLDIVSLCYIPLNCRIVLFVYQSLKHELPSTLTELYETFILHTIKHHAKRSETDPIVLQQIYDAATLHDLPTSISDQLSNLYELAFKGMKRDQLSFDKKDLRSISQQTLSLGLMNSIHSINVTGLQQHYQFLHLTIQEFLAAKFVASSRMSSKEKCEFLRTNLENTRYRMTLLFLAGLTKLRFVPKGESMLGTRAVDVSCQVNNQSETFLLLCHLVFESHSSDPLQHIYLKSHSHLSLTNASFTPFDALIFNHFLSAFPSDHQWEVIDLEYCQLSDDVQAVLFSREHCTIPPIAIARYLALSEANVSLLSAIIPTSNLTDLALHLERTVNHNSSYALSKSIAAKLDLNLKLFGGAYGWEEGHQPQFLGQSIPPPSLSQVGISMVTKKELVLYYMQYNNCSKSFSWLLKHIDLDHLERLEVPNHSQMFQDCKKCNFSVSVLIQDLCSTLAQCKNITTVNLLDCRLSIQTIENVVDSLLDKTKLKVFASSTKGAIVSSSRLLVNGTSVCDGTIWMVPHEDTVFVGYDKKSCYGVVQPVNINVDTDYWTEVNNLPPCFKTVSIHCRVTKSLLPSFLSDNDYIQNVHFFYQEMDLSDGIEDLAALCDMFSSYPRFQLQQFLIKSEAAHLEVSRSSLIFPHEPSQSVATLTYGHWALSSLLKFLVPDRVEAIILSGECKAFSGPGSVLRQLTDILQQSKHLKTLILPVDNDLSDQALNDTVVPALCGATELETFIVPTTTSNQPTTESLSALMSLTKVSFADLDVSVGSHSMSISVAGPSTQTPYTSFLCELMKSNPKLKIELTCSSVFVEALFKPISHRVTSLSILPSSLAGSTSLQLLRGLGNNSTLKTLKFERVKLSCRCKNLGKALQEMLQSNNCLEVLHLVDCMPSADLGLYLGHGLSHNSSIKELKLSVSVLSRTDELFKGIAENHHLHTLSISRGKLGGFFRTRHIAITLQSMLSTNKCLHTLRLTGGCLNATLLCFIQKGLTGNSTLRELDISGNDFSRGIKESLGISLKLILTENSSLQVLKVSNCNVHYSCLENLAVGLATNTTLVKLYLDQIYMYFLYDQTLSWVWPLFFRTLKRNNTIMTLSVCHNYIHYIAMEEYVKQRALHDGDKFILRTEGCRDATREYVNLKMIH